MVIHDTQTFLQRAIEKLKSFPYNVKARFVNYYDDKILHENLSPFDKPNKYSYENEFRILVMGHSEPTLQIEIGSIKDISVILESKDLLKLSIKTLKDEK